MEVPAVESLPLLQLVFSGLFEHFIGLLDLSLQQALHDLLRVGRGLIDDLLGFGHILGLEQLEQFVSLLLELPQLTELSESPRAYI